MNKIKFIIDINDSVDIENAIRRFNLHNHRKEMEIIDFALTNFNRVSPEVARNANSLHHNYFKTNLIYLVNDESMYLCDLFYSVNETELQSITDAGTSVIDCFDRVLWFIDDIISYIKRIICEYAIPSNFKIEYCDELQPTGIFTVTAISN